MPDKLLFSDESEKAVLSILLNNPSKLLETIELKGFMFSSIPHQVLFDSIVGLGKEGVSPEPLLLIEHLKVKNILGKVGDSEYIHHLAKGTYAVDSFRKFSNIIADSYKARSLLSVSHQVPEMVNTTSNIDSLISNVREKLGSLLITIGGEKTISVNDYASVHYEEIKERIAHPGFGGFSTGFSGIDLAIGNANPGDLILVAARPSMGKTAWMISSALKSEIPCLIFSKEMNRSMIMDRFISILSKIPLFDLRRGTVSDEKLSSLSEGVRTLGELDIYLDTNYMSDFNYILNTIRKYHQTHGVQAIYVDYVQLVVERDENSTNEIGRVSRMLKLIANELGIVVYLVSQLNRLVESREDKRPILSDLRQSGNLEEDSDIVIFLYRDEYYNKNTTDKFIIENIVRKNRNGPTGTYKLKFNPETIEIFENTIIERR